AVGAVTEATGRALLHEPAPGGEGSVAAEVRGDAQAAAGRAPANEPRARGKGSPPGRSKRGSRAEEPRNRTGAAGPAGKGRAARPHLEIQVGIPGEYVPRAPHAAQQHAHPLEDAGGEQGR